METISFETASRLASEFKSRVTEFIFGQDEVVTEVLCCLLANGHVLMTGAPGLAKTTLVRVIARFLGVENKRIQFTADLLPSDIVGSEILNIDPENQKRSFVFSEGPVFTNLLLADEINRASPRTQSALLEAMQERGCTIGGVRYTLPNPFMVFATQNPFESEGTFPLPEAQMDRFLLHCYVPYPDEDSEMKILSQHRDNRLVGEAAGGVNVGSSANEPLLDVGTLMALMKSVQMVHIDDNLVRVVNKIVRATRPTDPSCPEDLKDFLWYGAGPRAGLSLISTAKALAVMSMNESVRWKHIRRLVKPVLRHRIKLSVRARDRHTEDSFIDEVTDRIEAQYTNLVKGP